MIGYRCLPLTFFALALGAATPAPLLAGKATSGDTAAAAPASGHVNINTASVKELMTLDGVGRKVAEKIVEYREAHGPFKRPEDLRKVEGFGAGLWDQNHQRVVVK
ncbi:MAG TPA: helix-hairpin-helix domain-containing protein [Methylomirabilota bacterium]